jgi:hypothetical protein
VSRDRVGVPGSVAGTANSPGVSSSGAVCTGRKNASPPMAWSRGRSSWLAATLPHAMVPNSITSIDE